MRREKFNLKELKSSFIFGAIALIFLIVGYQLALFIHASSVAKITADNLPKDTVYIYSTRECLPSTESSKLIVGVLQNGHNSSNVNQLQDEVIIKKDRVAQGTMSQNGTMSQDAVMKNGTISQDAVQKGIKSSERAKTIRKNLKSYESFVFNPNTVSLNDLQRLGFSEKQAQAIDNYRKKGGRFHRKSDFAKSFVVSDSIYKRLEPYINIPLLDLNLADSAALDALPGIGAYYVKKIIQYREILHGFSYKEQLLDIPKFDQERYDKLKDLITVDWNNLEAYPLWTYPEDSLSKHPYITKYSSRAIILFRENNDRSKWTLEELDKAGILKTGMADKLSRCKIQ